MIHFGGRRLYTSKKALGENLIENGLSGTRKNSTLSQQKDSSAAVVSSSFTPNSSSTGNPYDVSDGMANPIEKCLNSSPPQQLNGVSKSLSVGKFSLRSDLFLPKDSRTCLIIQDILITIKKIIENCRFSDSDVQLLLIKPTLTEQNN